VNWLTQISRSVWVSAWYTFAIVLVVVAALFGAVRLLLPFAGQYNTEIEARVSAYLGQPVEIRSLDAEWRGWGPSLVLQDVSLLDAEDRQPILRLEKTRLGLDLLASLRQSKPVFSRITLVGAKLVLSRDAEGRIAVAGLAEQQGDDNETMGATADWLLAQGELRLENSEITWQDETSQGKPLHFSAVNISLRNVGQRHLLDVSINLPKILGRALSLHIDMEGDPLLSKGRRTRIYLVGEEVRLAELFAAQSVGKVAATVDKAGFQIWGLWQDGKLQSLHGDIDAQGIGLGAAAGGGEPLLLSQLAGHFRWQRETRGWRFDGDDVVLERKGHLWMPSTLSLGYAVNEAVPEIQIAASYLQLEDVAELMSLFAVGGEAIQAPLRALTPRGEVHDAQVRWQGGPDRDLASSFQAYARLRGASVNAWRSVPAADRVDGQLWVDADGGQVVLERAAVTLDFPKLFRWPLPVDDLRGQLDWRIAGEGWQVAGRNLIASNADIRARASLDIVRENDVASPFMSLVVNFEDGDGSQVARYLPTGIMSTKVVDWLDEAIVSARIDSGGAIFHGRLRDFPFDRGNGRFEVSFGVHDASLNYVRGWPPLTNIDAQVQFLGRGMAVDAQRGRIFSNEVQWAQVRIPDMTVKPLRLGVEGEVQGLTQEKLDYLVAAPPLHEAFGQYLEDMSAEGDSLLHLDLDLPIGSDERAQVQGWVTMQDNALSIPPLGKVLDKVEGRLRFFQDGLEAEEIRADLLGQASHLTIVTDAVAAQRKVRIQAKGMYSAEELAARYLPGIQPLLSGLGDWDVMFEIPVGEAEAGPRTATLLAVTDLKGIEARLPPPFNKASDDAAGLGLRVDFHPQQAPILRLDYAGFIEGIFELGAEATAGVKRGEIRLSGGTVKLPEAPGLRLVGWLDTVSLDDWRSFLPGEAGVAQAVGDEAPFLHSADVALRRLEAYGQQLQDVQLKLEHQDGHWQGEVQSRELKGEFKVPSNLARNALEARLDFWQLNEPKLAEGSVDPREVPAMHLQVGDFRYKDRQFGSLKIDTTKVANGLRIEQLILKPRSTTITANGGWYVGGGGKQNSNIKMHVTSRNIGKTLTALGYVGGIDEGKGTLNLDLQWPGSFADASAQNIQGSLNMDLSDGQLLDVEPGAGRMFGMLSIQTLPRRLLLDFSDVFKKGFGFDRIEGDFRIEGGDAYTNNLFMKGPAATVEIAGRVGLATQDYDQLVTVTPHVAESLPLLGALTAAPQVGAAILFVQKLFKPQIDDVARNQYTITGPWNEPVINKVKKKVAPVVSDGE
jgi:uncharacterized protein (TIGR02099 family)